MYLLSIINDYQNPLFVVSTVTAPRSETASKAAAASQRPTDATAANVSSQISGRPTAILNYDLGLAVFSSFN